MLFKGSINEETGKLAISKKKLEGPGVQGPSPSDFLLEMANRPGSSLSPSLNPC